ncbi:MAG: hypothetical protein A2277_10690 [Desulfobacterales bacterium RIFOXYA12_FULL_46_15]|nr:MAG: hypothetical protein A2277_10690 [Desulfobacterales bacterium RIFOXYA12_FULL_46_15]
MIPAHIIKKIRRIHIKSGRAVNSIMAGQYRSVFRGSGIEFEEVREYSPGDEVKSIDWKVSARLGKPFVKLYREERESIVMLLIDMSSSLKFGTFHGPAIEKAAETASVLAFNAVKNNDKVGVIFFTDRVEKYIPPKKGSSHVWRVIKEIFTFSPLGRGTNISGALDFLAKISKKRSFVFILSDFLDDGYQKSLRTVGRRHEPIGVMIYDKGGFQLPFKGIVTLSDFETSRQITLDGFSKKTKNEFTDAREAARKKTLDIFSKARSDVIELETGALVSDTLQKYFRQRERRNR